MAHYRVEFSRDWLTGRWSFIDHIFHGMGGRPTDSARLENAWLVEYKRGAGGLGKLLAERLRLKPADYSQFGVIFDIREIGSPDGGTTKIRRPVPRAQRLNAPER